jgi:tetratricopeptide (TPR) repeat protein
MRLSPADDEACPAIGLAYERAGQVDDAAAALQRCIDVLPEDAASRTALAFNALHRDEPEQALALAQAARARAPDDGQALFAAGLALQRLERFRDARLYLERAVLLRDGDPEIHYALGRLNEQEGRPAEARREYGRVQELAPGHAGASRRLAALTKGR